MKQSIISHFFLGTLFLAGLLCFNAFVQVLSGYIVNNTLPAALGRSTPYSMYLSFAENVIITLPFLITFVPAYMLVTWISQKASEMVCGSLLAGGRLNKDRFSNIHLDFTAQMMALLSLPVTAGWLVIQDTILRYSYLFISITAVIALWFTLTVHINSFDEKKVRKLWNIISLCIALLILILTRRVIFTACFVFFALYMIPLEKKIRTVFSSAFRFLQKTLDIHLFSEEKVNNVS